MDQNSKTRSGCIAAQIIVDVIIWLSVALPTLYLFLRGTPNKRGFFCDDDSLGFPYKPDTIPTPILIAAGFTISVFIIVLTEVLNCVDKKCRNPCPSAKEVMFCLKSYAVFLVGFIIQELVVDVVKNQIGVLRPNFFDVCRPDFNRTLCPSYITDYRCTGSKYGENIVRDSWKSFPSGHAAFSMYIAAFFCIFIQERLQIKFSRILKLFLQYGLIFLAILCGLGRIKDNKHHPSDVIAGFVLGITVAVVVCRTVGEKPVWSSSDSCLGPLPLPVKDQSRGCCCSKEKGKEPQTPSPLLPNEYFHCNLSDSNFSPPISVQNNKSRTLPPLKIRPISGPEAV